MGATLPAQWGRKMPKPDLDIVALQRQFRLTVRFRRVREYRVRMWIGRRLIQIAAWVMAVEYTEEALYELRGLEHDQDTE